MAPKRKSVTKKSQGQTPPGRFQNHSQSKSSNKNTFDNLSHSDSELDDDVWICKFCLTHFSDDSDKLIICERCNKPVCLSCSSLTDADYDRLSSKDCPYMWCCHECKAPALKALRTDNDIEMKCKEHFETLSKEMKKEIHDMKNRLGKLEKLDIKNDIKEMVSKLVKEELESEKSNLAHDTDKPTYASAVSNGQKKDKEDIVKESISEIRDRDRRKLNLILYNVEESKAASIDEKVEHDINEATKVMKTIGVDDKVTVSKPVRLSKSKSPKHKDKPRPLRITVASQEERRIVLLALKNMEEGKKSKLKPIFLKRDMTPLERQEMIEKLEKIQPKDAESKVEGESQEKH